MIFNFFGGVRGVKNGCIKLPYSPLYFLEEYWTKTIKRVEKANKYPFKKKKEKANK